MRAERQADEQTMSGMLSKLEMGAKAEQNRDQKKTGKNHKNNQREKWAKRAKRQKLNKL